MQILISSIHQKFLKTSLNLYIRWYLDMKEISVVTTALTQKILITSL